MMSDTEQIRELFVGWEPTLECEAPGHRHGIEGCQGRKAEFIIVGKHTCEYVKLAKSYVVCQGAAIWLRGRMQQTGLTCTCGYGIIVGDFFDLSPIRGADNA
jgi:hypothetical protein